MKKTPGQQLKAAREELGKSQSEMAKVTRMGLQQLQGLEADCYDKIPAPMYVRGFIKLYAQQLGLEYEPLVEMYERIRKGESSEPAAAKAPPRPVQEDERMDEEVFHPEISREVHRKPVETPSRFDWQVLRSKVPKLPERIPLDWLKDPRIRMAGIAFVVLMILVTGLRSCGSGEKDPQDPPVIPVVDEPWLSPPEPVYFQLPSSYQ